MEAGRPNPAGFGSWQPARVKRGDALKRYLWIDALILEIRTGWRVTPDRPCFHKNRAVVALIPKIIAGFLLDKRKLPLVEPMVYPAEDGINLADGVRIAGSLFNLPPNDKPEKISRQLVGGEAFETHSNLSDVGK